MKFGLNLRINESVMCANCEDPRSRDDELIHLKPGNNRNYCVENLIIRL